MARERLRPQFLFDEEKSRRYGDAHHYPGKDKSGKIYVATSAAGAFRADDDGEAWKPPGELPYSQHF